MKHEGGGDCAHMSSYTANWHPASHFPDRAGWHAKMAAFKLRIQWRNAHGRIVPCIHHHCHRFVTCPEKQDTSCAVRCALDGWWKSQGVVNFRVWSTHNRQAYVRPTMEYASPLWHGSICEEDALRLQRIQTAVACCILQAPWYTPKSQLLEALDWPSLRWRREIASFCLLHRFLKQQENTLTICLPPFAFSRNPRSQSPTQLILPAVRTSKHTTSFIFSTSVVWNTLPAHIQNIPNDRQFKNLLTKHLPSNDLP